MMSSQWRDEKKRDDKHEATLLIPEAAVAQQQVAEDDDPEDIDGFQEPEGVSTSSNPEQMSRPPPKQRRTSTVSGPPITLEKIQQSRLTVAPSHFERNRLWCIDYAMIMRQTKAFGIQPGLFLTRYHGQRCEWNIQ